MFAGKMLVRDESNRQNLPVSPDFGPFGSTLQTPAESFIKESPRCRLLRQSFLRAMRSCFASFNSAVSARKQRWIVV